MTKAHWMILGAGLLALPFVFSADVAEQMREPKAQFLVMIAGLLLAVEIGQRISWSLSAGAALCYLSAFFQCRAFPYEQILPLSAALGSCLLFAHFKKHDVERFLEFLEWAGVLTAAYAMLIQWKGIDPILRYVPGADFARVSVFFGQHTLYGPFCVAAAASALFRGRYGRALLISTPLPLIDSSFTYLSAGVALATFLIFRFGRRAILGLSLMAALGVIALGYVYLGSDFVKREALNDNGRFALWKITWQVSRPRWIVGHGFSSYQTQFPVFQSKEVRELNGLSDDGLSPKTLRILASADELRRRSGFFTHPHNELLLVFYEFGLVGLFIALCLIFSFYFFWVDAPDTPENWALGAIFFSFMANSAGSFPLHLIPQALIPLWAFVLVTTCRDRGILEI
jgi:hypothetical protein